MKVKVKLPYSNFLEVVELTILESLDDLFNTATYYHKILTLVSYKAKVKSLLKS